jgi:hypothetical protein
MPWLPSAQTLRASLRHRVEAEVSLPHEALTVTRPPLEFRGAALAAQTLTTPEWMLCGPADTGKTIAALTRLDSLARTYAGSQHVMMRKTYTSAVASVVQSFVRKVLPTMTEPGVYSDVQVYGGEHPQWFDYDNGSRVWVGGMDNPNKVLSTERDTVYVNQAEELTLADWEYLTTRANGRAGTMPYGMVFGDCNPGGPGHWIRKREGLQLLESRHEDNPSLFDGQGNILEAGVGRMAVLDRLTGVRKERLRFGRWVNAEGAVYEFDEAVHLIDPFVVPLNWRRLRVVDFGYTNPFVCQWWAVDHDGRMYLYREIYMTRRTVQAHAPKILALSGLDAIETTVADHDAEDRATLEAYGIPTEAAVKSISVGIQKVEERLKRAGDGKPRLFVFRDACVEVDESLAEARKPTRTAEEFAVYMWPKGSDGKPLKEVPVDDNNHGMDAMRYAVMYVEAGRREGEVGYGRNPLEGYRG